MLPTASDRCMQLKRIFASVRNVRFTGKTVRNRSRYQINSSSRSERTILYLATSFQHFDGLHPGYIGEIISCRSGIRSRCRQYTVLHNRDAFTSLGFRSSQTNVRAKTETGATCAPMARPNWMAFSTAPRFMTGNTPGNARSTGQACVLGFSPKWVEAPLKILDTVESCACVSRPMTTSHCIVFPLMVVTVGTVENILVRVTGRKTAGFFSCQTGDFRCQSVAFWY